jgi:membrane-associated phospholipid phosphatase
MNRCTLALTLSLFCLNLYSQQPVSQSVPYFTDSLPATPSIKKQRAVSFLLPAAMVGYGIVALNNPTLQKVNENIYDEVQRRNSSFTSGIENYLQYVPAVSVYILDAAGVKAAHRFGDRTILLLTSATINVSTVMLMKHFVDAERPDKSDYKSFPSGHASIAFMSAEFMNKEYAYKSPWFGISAYAVASLTGALRIYGDRHWFSDVVAGAGIGILSTKTAYLIYPWLKRTFFKKKSMNTLIMPSYQSGMYQLVCIHTF